MKKIIIDCDPGIDDAIGILWALQKTDIQGITTVYGNVPLSQTTSNALRLLEFLGKNIPVVPGAEVPLCVPPVDYETMIKIHGKDGLGDLPESELIKYPTTTPYQAEASDFIAAQIEQGVRTLVALGPLTNIAHAFQKHPQQLATLEKLVIMGGVINGLENPGNIDRMSEANFYHDPHAADYVIRQPVPKLLVPLNVTEQILFSSSALNYLYCTKKGKLARALIGQYQKKHAQEGITQGCYLHDPLAVACAFKNKFVKTRPMNIRVETKGEYTRGVCVPELRNSFIPNIEVALEVDADSFIHHLTTNIY